MGVRSSRDIYIDKTLIKNTIETLATSNDGLAVVTREAYQFICIKKKFPCSSYTDFREILMVYNEGSQPKTLNRMAIICALAIDTYVHYHLDPETLTNVIIQEMQLPWIVNLE